MKGWEMFKRKEKKNKPALKKDTGAKILRFVLWGILIFLTVRGVISIVKPDQTAEIKEEVKRMESDVKKNVEQNTEILAFAEQFVKEWYTYSTEEEFKIRVSSYVIPDILSQQYIHDFKSTAIVTDVNAYRVATYANGQYDVYASVTYTNTRLEAVSEGTEEANNKTQKKSKTKDTIKQVPVTTTSSQLVQIPIQVTENDRYIAEGIPLVVSDPEYLPDKYVKNEVSLAKIDDTSLYQETVSNYLKAYYGDTQSVTDYFLAADAVNREQLYGFIDPGKIEFVTVNEVKAYRKAEGEALCIVTYQIKDISTQTVSLQQCNILIDDQSIQRLYIKNMDTKIYNLKEDK